MNTTSFELSKRIFEAFGWNDTDSYWYPEHQNYLSDGSLDTIPSMLVSKSYRNGTSPNKNFIPAYSLGFLLRKLPKFYEEGKTVYLLTMQPNPIGAGWQAHYRFASRIPNSSNTDSRFRQVADTPEEAAGELCLKLKEEGMLL